jgi:hypothetical protein
VVLVEVGEREVNIVGEHEMFATFLDPEDGMQVLIYTKKIELGQAKLITSGS